MKATTIREAWNIADEIFPTDYAKNESKSARAGYDIYESTLEGCTAWISDLGNRLEINLDDGKTINIWIEAETATEATERRTERREAVISVELDIHRGSRKNNATEHFETSLTLSHETTLKSIATFEKDMSLIIRKARKAARDLDWAMVIISKAHYCYTSWQDMKQTHFEIWSGSGNDITEDGAHLNPDERYNNDPAHDMWLTGKIGEIFNEITI